MVKEFGEGVDRMYREMEEAGCPAPEYKQGVFMVYATIRQHKGPVNVENDTLNSTLNYTLNDILKRLNPTQKRVYEYICANHGVQAKTIVAELNIKRDTLNKVLKTLTGLGLIVHKESKKTGGYYPVASMVQG